MLTDIMATLLASSISSCVPVQDYIEVMQDLGATFLYEEIVDIPNLPYDGILYYGMEGSHNVATTTYTEGCMVHYTFGISKEAVEGILQHEIMD